MHPVDKMYGGKGFVEERHRHRYEVNPEYVPQLEEKGLKFVGKSTDLQRMEVMEMKTESEEEGRGEAFYVAVVCAVVTKQRISS